MYCICRFLLSFFLFDRSFYHECWSYSSNKLLPAIVYIRPWLLLLLLIFFSLMRKKFNFVSVNKFVILKLKWLSAAYAYYIERKGVIRTGPFRKLKLIIYAKIYEKITCTTWQTQLSVAPTPEDFQIRAW